MDHYEGKLDYVSGGHVTKSRDPTFNKFGNASSKFCRDVSWDTIVHRFLLCRRRKAKQSNTLPLDTLPFVSPAFTFGFQKPGFQRTERSGTRHERIPELDSLR